MRQSPGHNTTSPLRTGYTTGACATAAAKGAAAMLLEQKTVAEVTIDLPAGISATFPLHGQEFGPGSASCFVVKDAGDDPDVTNGAEVHARVTVDFPFTSPPLPQGEGRGEGGARPDRMPHPHPIPPLEGEGTISITGGTGIGKATKPGLAVAPGEWAINPVPRRMITEAVHSVFSTFNIQHSTFNLSVVISIPDGEQRAQKTLNSRLGIVGGLSILGTSGIVRPLSAKAWTDTIDAALDVARACGCATVVLSTGRTSEMAVQRQFQASGYRFQDLEHVPWNLKPLPEEAYIMMGDHVAHALAACAGRGYLRPVIACQFAKLLKIACGHGNTHAAASEMDLSHLRTWAEEARLPSPLCALIARAHTAREIALESGFDRSLMELVCRQARAAASGHVPGLKPGFQVADYAGNIVYHSS